MPMLAHAGSTPRVMASPPRSFKQSSKLSSLPVICHETTLSRRTIMNVLALSLVCRCAGVPCKRCSRLSTPSNSHGASSPFLRFAHLSFESEPGPYSPMGTWESVSAKIGMGLVHRVQRHNPIIHVGEPANDACSEISAESKCSITVVSQSPSQRNESCFFNSPLLVWGEILAGARQGMRPQTIPCGFLQGDQRLGSFEWSFPTY